MASPKSLAAQGVDYGSWYRSLLSNQQLWVLLSLEVKGFIQLKKKYPGIFSHLVLGKHDQTAS